MRPSASLPVYLTSEIRELEVRAVLARPGLALMERAGCSAAEYARDRLLDHKKSVLVLAGPGNNGGDGFVLARYLKQWWYTVSVAFAGLPAKLSQDARTAYEAWLAMGGEVLDDAPRHRRFDLVVDALFGIGLERDVVGRCAELIAFVNAQPAPVLAIDIPSGLHADSGRVLGIAVRAHHTVTFIALKPGLLTLDGPDRCGAQHLETLGIDTASLLPSQGNVIGADVLARILPPRALNSHKGSFGSLGILGGATGMTGAALLAARTGLLLGAGRVYAGLLGEDAPSVDPVQPELMLRSAADVLEVAHLTSLVVGPGLSQSEPAQTMVHRALRRDCPLVVDADALNLIALDAGLQEGCRTRRAPTVITPHPAEAARLLAVTTADIQFDRVASARQLAQRYQAIVVLKGGGTVVAAPDGRFAINATGNPGMASAGMGDALCGILGAFLAQGADPWAATQAAVHLHGAAADAVRERLGGPVGMTASEVALAARAELNRRIYAQGATL